MFKRLGLVLCCGLFVFSAEVLANEHARNVNLVQESQRFVRSNKVAVVVGVNRYGKQSGLRPLDYAVQDAQLIKRALELRGYTVRLLTDNNANSDYILDAIKQAGKLVDPNQGTLAFFFSGHGFGDPRNKTNYLATSNTVSGNLANSALSLNKVEQAIRQTRVKRAIMLVDACRDNPFFGKSVAQPSFIQQHSQGIKALYSTKFGELSFETPQLGHGVFSHFLYQGLAGKAVEKDGVITFDSLKRFVQDETAKWTYSQFGKPQMPFTRERSDSFGVFVLGQVGNAPVVRHPQPRQPAPAPQRPAPVATRPTPAAPATRKSFEPEMVNIPAGSFMMGCVAGRDDVVEGGCADDEKPAHRVNLQAFKISKYEVTFDEWDACERAKACPHAKDEGWGRGRRPVINVTWKDAQQYLRWLSSETGYQYRLPSESEWEYAARGRGNSVYPWGPRISCGNARYGLLMNGNPCKSTTTVNVGSYGANGFGLYDTVGNVLEWTEDCYKNSYSGIPVNGTAYTSCGADASRVLRGGSWRDTPWFLRSATRYGLPSYRLYNVGFRAARTR